MIKYTSILTASAIATVLLARVYKAGKISFNELLVLLLMSGAVIGVLHGIVEILNDRASRNKQS